MENIDKKNYTDSVFYLMEQTVVYLRLKGSQFFNQEDWGLTLDQFAALDAIYTNEDICQRDLSKLILKDRSNTGRILNILEEKGFIKRLVETKSKRLVKKIYITPKGKNIIEKIQPKIKKAYKQTFAEVTEEEFKNLRAFLNKVNNILSQITSIQI